MKYEKHSETILELVDSLKAKGVSKEEYFLHVERLLERKARKGCIPLHGSFELTPFCNLDCKMCYVHLNEFQYKKSDLLDTETWIHLINQAHNAGMIRASLTGGECLTYNGFENVYLHLLSLGIRTSILTNGVDLDADRIHFFLRHRPRLIQVSLYGSSEDNYNVVTGHRVFNTVIKNLSRLRDEKLPVTITITPSFYMRDDIESLINVARDLRIPYNINAGLVSPRLSTGRKKKDLSNLDYLKIYLLSNDKYRETLDALDLKELPDENLKKSNLLRVGLRCGGGRSSFTIQYDGSMSPCVGLSETRTYPLDSSFLEAWASLNELASNYLMPSECGECIYHDNCLICPAMHKDAPPGHCDPNICEKTKLLTAAGLISLPEKG